MKRKTPKVIAIILTSLLFISCTQAPAEKSVSDANDNSAKDLKIRSSNDGGLNNYDSTGRLLLESYQKAQKTSENGEPAHYGEVIRIDVKDQQAKGAIAFREAYIDENNPRTVFWIVSHGEANDSTAEEPLWHNHTSFEIPDEDGLLRTVMEMPYGTYNEPDAYGVKMDDMYVRTTQKLIASNKGLYIEGNEGTDRTIKFSTGLYSSDEDRRFAVGIDSAEETGDNSGSNFRILTYNDDGSYNNTPLSIERSTGYVGIGTSTPSAPLDINADYMRIAEKRTINSSDEPGNVGDICWDDNYWYVCVAPNSWKRTALEEW